MIEATWIAFAFVMGLGARSVGLPPLVGYLGAGFALAGFGDLIGIGPRDSAALAHIAHLGVLLLLFTVGLKLKLGNLLRREVIGGGLLHFAISSLVFLPAILLLLDLPWQQALLLAIALSFSSTVLAAKVLEGKRELRAFHGRVAIGVLIIQDLIALAVMSLAAGELPSPWALTLFVLPLLRPLLFRLLDASGHEELMVLLGLLLALVVGGYGFEQLGLSSELGALAFGAMLAAHKRATELSNSLWSIKEVFLVGFFLQIGIGGLPDAHALAFAGAMALLLPLKGLLFFFLFLLFRLRARSAFLSSVSLTNYSEFGLIMASNRIATMDDSAGHYCGALVRHLGPPEPDRTPLVRAPGPAAHSLGAGYPPPGRAADILGRCAGPGHGHGANGSGGLRPLARSRSQGRRPRFGPRGH